MTATKKLLAALIIASGAAFVAAPTMAEGRGDCESMGPMGGERGPGRMAEFRKQHQQRLHDALKLNPDQEKAWTKYQESQPFGHMGGKSGMRDQPAELAKLSAPERADKMLERQRQHQDAMSKHVGAMKEFYALLTPEQKKTFDEQSMMQRHHGRKPGGQPPAAAAK